MSIIEQLEQTVTPALLGDHDNQGSSDNQGSVAYISLLEQFYAILAARLALPQIYSQLIRADQVMAADMVTERPLFEQLWHDPRMQQVIVQELSATHHIDEVKTAQLLINAAPLAYRELKILADGQFLPAFLQAEQSALRSYLPIWSAPVITATQSLGEDTNSNNVVNAGTATRNARALDKAQDSDGVTSVIVAAPTTSSMVADINNTDESTDIESTDIESTDIESTDGIHANPAAHHLAENDNMKRVEVRTRNQRNDLLIRVFLLIGAVAAIGLAVWALLIKPSNTVPVEPVVTAPVVVPPAPAEQIMTPVELIVGVDDSGNLYTCSATVGDEALQSTLQNALNTSFGEQASICTLAVQTDTATSIANISVEKLPNILTMLRSTPFARLQLQNDRLTLEAPDSMLLQRLVTDIGALAPAMTIDSTAPLPLPENNDVNAMNEEDNQFENEGAGTNNQYGNDDNGAGEYQASDDDTGDNVIPAPAPNNNDVNNTNNAADSIPRNVPSNTQRNPPSNNRPTRPPGPFSPAEVDEMASTVIVAEPAQVRQ